MVAQYIAMPLILYLCKRSVRRPGAWVYLKWWEQEGINPAGVRKRAAAAEARADREKERRREEAAW